MPHDNSLNQLSKNLSPAFQLYLDVNTQEVEVVTYRKFNGFFQSCVKSNILDFISLPNRKAEIILRDFVYKDMYLQSIDDRVLEAIVVHPSSSVELSMIALTALVKKTGKQYARNPSDELLAQFNINVQRLMMLGRTNDYFESFLWVLLVKLTEILDVENCLDDFGEWRSQIEYEIQMLNCKETEYSAKQFNYFIMDKSILYLNSIQQEDVLKAAIASLSEGDKILPAKICRTMWPYIGVDLREEVLKKAPDLFTKQEKTHPPKSPEEVLALFDSYRDWEKSVALSELKLVWKDFNEEQRSKAIERVFQILDKRKPYDMGYEAFPTIWLSLNADQKYQALRSIKVDLKNHGYTAGTAYCAVAMVYPHLTEQERQDIWKEVPWDFTGFCRSLNEEMLEKYSQQIDSRLTDCASLN